MRRWFGVRDPPAGPTVLRVPGARGRVTSLSGLSATKFVEENARVAVDLWAGWCRPCRTFSPIVEGVAEQFVGRVAFGKVNVERDPTLAERWQVRSIPTVLLFREGRPAGRLTGVRSADALAREVRRGLKVR